MPFLIREARPADAPSIARVHVETFNEAHMAGRSGGPSYELRERQWIDAFAAGGQWFCFVVENDAGELVGFAKGTRHDGEVPGFVGELNKIYVLRRFHRQGVGRSLLCSVAQRFISEGVTSMLLFGEAANPSNGFYEALGAERIRGKNGGVPRRLRLARLTYAQVVVRDAPVF